MLRLKVFDLFSDRFKLASALRTLTVAQIKTVLYFIRMEITDTGSRFKLCKQTRYSFTSSVHVKIPAGQYAQLFVRCTFLS
jgi:hypothetical protein